MKFALFYGIPVARPWSGESELQAYRNTLDQAILGDRMVNPYNVSHENVMQTIELTGKYVLPEFDRS